MSADATAPLSPRRSGLLLHPTSLPSRFGIGDLGPAADAWLRFLAEAGQQVWQVLPLTYTGDEDSPYFSPASFAGNPWLIDVADLVTAGLLEPGCVPCGVSDEPIDFDVMRAWKRPLLHQAA